MTVRTRKPAAERKKEIVDTAIRLAADCGPDRLTTERLAKEIGISQPAIFRHFPAKSDIWEAVGERICTLMGESGESIEATSSTDRLRKMVAAQLGFIQSTPAVPAILFSRELHSENEKLRAFFAGLMAQRQKKLSKLFTKGINSGEFNEEIDADDAAYLVLAIIQGLAMRWSLNNRNFDLVKAGSDMLEVQLVGFTRR
ncbi:MAG: TetR/AcrR family transcriptional regulator [Rhodobacteraceae bacterium]|nr:TetR/AcrR family transcriptional regulator [Paracoccaceae bacterium]